MPQVDLSSVCAAEEDDPQPQAQMDYAPESFWLSKDAELDWLDRNAFMERKDSGKSHSTNLGSNRYSGTTKSKPSIIGLPKPTKPNYAEAKNRRQCKPSAVRLFPKRSESAVNKAMSEPSSPKVSCMGRVRSRRGKNRKKGNDSVRIKDTKPGFWNNFRLMFRPKSHPNPNPNPNQNQNQKGGSIKKRGYDFNNNNNGENDNDNSSSSAPGLGGVKRFASGRRSDAWAAEVEDEPKSGRLIVTSTQLPPSDFC